MCLKADRGEWRGADLHIVQSRSDPLVFWNAALWPTQFMPHWPQPGLLPRDGERGDAFANVVYMGRPDNLLDEFQSEWWLEDLRDMGIDFQVPAPEQWHDYRRVDAVVAIRGENDKYDLDIKPASKLVNAWLAGAIPILGSEPEYRKTGRPGVDYLELGSPAEAEDALKMLRSDPEARRQLLEHGRQQATRYTPARVAARWDELFRETVVPTCQHKWQQLRLVSRCRRTYRGIAHTWTRALRVSKRYALGIG